LLGLVYAAGNVTEPVEILAHLIGASLIGLVYGLAVSDLILAPLALISRRGAEPGLEHQDRP
jgi:flagellar motor component MotA